MSDITRRTLPTQTIAITASIGTCDVIDYEHAAGGNYEVTVGASLTSLAWYGCSTRSGTYQPIYDKNGTAVSRTVAVTRGFAIPDECFAFPYLKALGNNTGTLVVSTKG